MNYYHLLDGISFEFRTRVQSVMCFLCFSPPVAAANILSSPGNAAAAAAAASPSQTAASSASKSTCQKSAKDDGGDTSPPPPPADSKRPIFPHLPYSPYCSPNSSPRVRRKPLRETTRVNSINDQSGEYVQLNQYKLEKGAIGQVRLPLNPSVHDSLSKES